MSDTPSRATAEATPRSAASRRRGSRLALAIFGIVVGLFASEGAARLALPYRNWTPDAGISTSVLTLTKHGYHRFKADLAIETWSRFHDRTPLFTDEHGFRIPDPSRRPAPDAAAERIFVVGASYTWGIGVPAEDTWPFVLERILALEGRPVRVTNAAVPGYALPQMLAMIDEIPADIRPDHVFVVMPFTGLYMLGFGSHAGDWSIVNSHANALLLLALMYDERSYPAMEEVHGWLLARDREFHGEPFDSVRTRTALGHRGIMRAFNRGRPTRIVRERRSLDVEALVATARAIGTRFRETADRLRASGVALHNIVIPANWPEMKDEMSPERQVVVTAYSKAAGILERAIDVVDLVNVGPWRIEMDTRLEGDFLIHDRHYSARGHKKVAEALARWFRTTPR